MFSIYTVRTVNMEKLTYGSDMELSEFYKNSDDIIDMWKKEYREQIR